MGTPHGSAIKLLVLLLLCFNVLCSVFLSGLTFKLKLLLILQLLHELKSVLVTEGVDVLLLQLTHLDCLLHLPLLYQLRIQIDLALTLYEPSHVLLYKWLLYDIHDLGPLGLVLDQKHVDKVFHAIAVCLRYWLLLVLDDLEH